MSVHERKSCEVCWGKINTGYHKLHCLRCGDYGKDGEKLMSELIDGQIQQWRGKEMPSIDAMVKNILTRFASHVSKVIPDWAATAAIENRLQRYLNAKRARNAKEFVGDIIANIKAHKFDKDARLFIRAIKANVEFLECLQEITSAGPFLIDDITNSDAKLRRILELDNDLDYIMLDRDDNACAYVKKPGPELLAKITQHEAEAFMSKHGLRADMAAMEADMRTDYRDLMHKVASEAETMGLRL